jgi:hypothetical protein
MRDIGMPTVSRQNATIFISSLFISPPAKNSWRLDSDTLPALGEGG